MTATTSSPAVDRPVMLGPRSPRPMAPAAKVVLLRGRLLVTEPSVAPSLVGSNIGNPGAVKGAARSQALPSEARTIVMAHAPTKIAADVAQRDSRPGLASTNPVHSTYENTILLQTSDRVQPCVVPRQPQRAGQRRQTPDIARSGATSRR